MNNFLPENYKVPSESNYVKLAQGDTRLRVLSNPILGMQYWTDTKEGRKPVRKQMDEKIIVADVPNPDEIKHFWAMVVYNYNDERVQIWEVTQKGIQRTLQGLSKDEDWGNPQGFDLVINREGEGFDTKYEVRPKPKKEVDPGVKQLFKDMNINLEALYNGDDPFAKEQKITDEDLDEMAKVIPGGAK